MPRPPTDDPDRTWLTTLLFRTRTLSDTVALDQCLYTSTHNLWMTCTVNTYRNNFHDCTLHAARLSSYCTRPHPCTVTAAHHIHTRPPDILGRLAYQRPLVNTYCTSDLCRHLASDDVQNASNRHGRVAGIPPCTRSSSSDILHTHCPTNIGPRGDCVSFYSVTGACCQSCHWVLSLCGVSGRRSSTWSGWCRNRRAQAVCMSAKVRSWSTSRLSRIRTIKRHHHHLVVRLAPVLCWQVGGWLP
jgi:hypothetical protein